MTEVTPGSRLAFLALWDSIQATLDLPRPLEGIRHFASASYIFDFSGGSDDKAAYNAGDPG